ncbi:GHKL domain-containing protein [Lysinibacillus fusiformis]|uniref:sensor histidine kinase n=1 Tax=Lysinibacillus fusiformis TaxID=28031 RepID=UPI00196761FF|nr:GHKL domain-containing protein [Lysinibacillus fusiformis]QSB08728.1 GHKL domain-containing protein [Lysinibacillus fusiformis]
MIALLYSILCSFQGIIIVNGVSYSISILIFLILMLIARKKYKYTYSSIIAALLLSAIFLLKQILIMKIILYIIPSKFYLQSILFMLLICFLILMCVYKSKITILPPQSESFTGIEKNSNMKYNFIFVYFVLTLIIFWLVFFIENINLFLYLHQILIFSFTFLVFFLLIYLIKKVIYSNMEKVELLKYKRNQSELLSFMSIIRTQRHDFNFHLQAISGMLDNKRYIECSDYVKTMVKESNLMNEVLPLYHPAISALLITFKEVAEQKGINLDILIYNNLENIPCTVYDVNKIIGNLVQNAIDEVEKNIELEQNIAPWIQIMIFSRNGNNVIKVSNKISSNFNNFRNIFSHEYSTKEEHEGIGLTSVQLILSKCNGTIYTEFEEETIHFIAKIPFSIEQF